MFKIKLKSIVGRAFLLPWCKKNLYVFCTLIFIFAMVFAVPTTFYFLQQGNSMGMLWLGIPFVLSLLFYFFYIPVLFKMNRLRSKVSQDAVIQSDCLIVRGIVQTPGIAQIKGQELVLTPLIGQPTVMSLSEVKLLKESCWFNGSYYPGQSGFWIQPNQPSLTRLGFAVPEGDAWRDYFDTSLLKPKKEDSNG